MIPTKDTFLQVRPRIAPYIHNTPVMSSTQINAIVGAELYFKCENFQKMGAFKMRGASNAVIQLSDEAKQKGIATHSSGNFAQAMALTARNLGIPAYIVMPNNAPAVKKAAVLGYGAEVIESGPTQKDREAMLDKVVARTGATFVHPYNDHQVILGQATAAQELIEEVGFMDYIIAPLGGGGLTCGTAIAAKYLSPETKTLAAEPFLADDAYHSIKDNKISLKVWFS